MEFVKRFPVTIFLLAANTLVFIACYLQAQSFAEPTWTITLVEMGAEFNPLTLDKEWYRIFTHMFLHGHVLHLLCNMYALFAVGSVLEQAIGSTKFIQLYVIAGVAAALASLYWNLFTVGVGASGAILGLFGFSVVRNIFQSHREGRSIVPILVNFMVFLVINLVFAKALHADNAAHMGGLAAGALFGGLSLFETSSAAANAEYIFLPALLAIFFLLPRYQVTYYHFFQKVFVQEDSARLLFAKRLTDDQFAASLKHQNAGWDSTLRTLSAIPFLPGVLHFDTFKLRRYIHWRKKENDFRILLIEHESYIYMDSIEFAGTQMMPFLSLEHIPPRFHNAAPAQLPPPIDENLPAPVQVWYDENWEELPSGPGKFYRTGGRDSLGRWQGKVKDFYTNGDVQMKGAFHNDRRDGIFIYYSDHHTYEAAGRYREDRRIGKWENYYRNGHLESEEYYQDRYFLKNYWDSTGVQLVKDGFGHVVKRFANGVVREEGSYRDGRQQDLWMGRHPDGQVCFEEYYLNGRLTKGRSRNLDGKYFVYDESSFFPTPAGGWKQLAAYITQAAAKLNARSDGRVRLSFRVTLQGKLTDIKVEKSLSGELDEKAKEILLKGPRWIPAHTHGFQVTDGIAFVNIDFEKSR